MSRTLAILGFHKIGPAPGGWETWFYVPQATFVGYLDFLKEDGWQVLDVAAFLRGLVEPDSLPERAALITFDDGYRSILDYGLPELRRFGYPAVMFATTSTPITSRRRPFAVGRSCASWNDVGSRSSRTASRTGRFPS